MDATTHVNNEWEEEIGVDPTNSQNLFVAANEDSDPNAGNFLALSVDPGSNPLNSTQFKTLSQQNGVSLNLGTTGFIALRLLHVALPGVPVEATAAAATKEEKAKEGPVVAVDPFVVNLNEPGSNRYSNGDFGVVDPLTVSEDGRGLSSDPRKMQLSARYTF